MFYQSKRFQSFLFTVISTMAMLPSVSSGEIYDPYREWKTGYRKMTQCDFQPFSASTQVWLPYMYLDPVLKGTYIPAFSQGLIRMNPFLKSEAPKAWPNASSGVHAVISETNYTSTVKADSATLQAPLIALAAHKYESDDFDAPANYKIEEVLSRKDAANINQTYARFLTATGAEAYNKGLCNRFMTADRKNQGYRLDGTAFAPRKKYDAETNGAAQSKYYAVSKDLYAISDLYFIGKSDGLVDQQAKKTFVFGKTSAQDYATEIFGCNLCKDVYVKVSGPYGGPIKANGPSTVSSQIMKPIHSTK